MNWRTILSEVARAVAITVLTIVLKALLSGEEGYAS